MPRGVRNETRTDRPPLLTGDPAEKPSARGELPAKQRKERIPLGVARSQLTAPPRPGYVRRWINDDGKGRLQKAQEGGYTFVEDPNLRVGEDDGGSRSDSRVSRIVGKTTEGKPMRAYAMEIREEWYREDQASKRQTLDEVDRAIRKGRLVENGSEHRYVPDDGRAITVGTELTGTARDADDD